MPTPIFTLPTLSAPTPVTLVALISPIDPAVLLTGFVMWPLFHVHTVGGDRGFSFFFLSSSSSNSPVRIKIPFELEQAEEKRGGEQRGSYLTGSREGG